MRKSRQPLPSKQAVIYARVSSKEQEKEGFSIPSQLKLLRDYAAQNGAMVIREFVDVETAKRTGRTFFNEMMALLKKERQKQPGVCQAIFVEKTDRLYRNIKDWVTVDELGAEVHFVKENVVLSSESRSSEKFMHGIKVLMAKNYIDNLSEETAKGMLEKARQGLYPSNAPFGYCNITDSNLRKIILPHPINGPLVTQIYAWYASGEYSLSGIYERLNTDFSCIFENERKLTRSTVYKLLTNPIYYGDFIWNGEYYRGTHEPLVSRELFDAVQDVLKLHGKRNIAQKTHRFAFRGLIRCGHCGCAMVAELKKGKYIYYHCTQNKGKCPGGVSIPENEIDRQFAMSLAAVQMPPEAVGFVVDAMKESHKDKKEYQKRMLAELQAELERVQNRLDVMYLDRLDGKVEAAYYDRKHREWRREVEKIQKKMLKHNNANECYLDEGIQLLELVQHAVDTYKVLELSDRGSFLKLVHSNFFWKDGILTVEYKQPFDFIAELNAEYAQKMAVSREKNGHCFVWLPNPDSSHGQGGWK